MKDKRDRLHNYKRGETGAADEVIAAELGCGREANKGPIKGDRDDECGNWQGLFLLSTAMSAANPHARVRNLWFPQHS